MMHVEETWILTLLAIYAGLSAKELKTVELKKKKRPALKKSSMSSLCCGLRAQTQ